MRPDHRQLERLQIARTDMTRIITLTGDPDSQQGIRIAADLAARLCASGRRVCLLTLHASADRNGGLPGWSGITTLADSLSGDSEASVLQHASGCDLVIGGHNSHWLRALDETQLTVLAERLQHLDDYDFLFIDAAGGSDQNQLAFALASPELLLRITPASASLSAAYGLLKLLYAEQYGGSTGIVVAQCDSETDGRHTYDKLRGIAGFYLEMPLPLAGIIGTHDTDADVEKLASRILQEPADTISTDLDMATFSRRYLQAAGVLPEPADRAAFTPVFATPAHDHELHDQLETLSAQVDDLIAEVARLRSDEIAAPQPAQPQPPRAAPTPVQHFDAAAIAAMAHGEETVSVAGETFTVYHLRQTGGRQLRFACQSIDDDLEEPEPQSYFP